MANGIKYLFGLCLLLLLFPAALFGGNPERTGQAGTTQLLINPHARSGGLNGINITNVAGIEAFINNPAGICMIPRTEVTFSHTQWMAGSGMMINTVGLGQTIKKIGTIGVQFMAFGVGDVRITTIDNPDGNLGTFTPTFINVGLSYSRAVLEDRVFVGFTLKVVNESIPDVGVTGVAFDAGVQYRSKPKPGESDGRFKLGVALRNVGPEMKFSGDGLTVISDLGGLGSTYNSALETKAAGYEMPSVLMMGLSYDFKFGIERDSNDNSIITRVNHRVTPMATFISNTFTNDQYGIGVEYAFRDMFFVRGSYVYEEGLEKGPYQAKNLNSGFAAGAGFQMEFKTKKQKEEGRAGSKIGIDYSFRSTFFFAGTHAVGVRFSL